MDHQSATPISEAIYARVVKSCSRADSIPSAFSQVQEATGYVRMSRHFDLIVLEFKTYQKDGYRRHKSRPGQACSRRQRAHRCTDQRGESLKIILVSNDLISILIIREIQTYGKSSGGLRSRSQRKPCCKCSGGQTPCRRSTWPGRRRRSLRPG